MRGRQGSGEDRASLFDEGSTGEWRGQGVRDRTSLFGEGSAGEWR